MKGKDTHSTHTDTALFVPLSLFIGFKRIRNLEFKKLELKPRSWIYSCALFAMALKCEYHWQKVSAANINPKLLLWTPNNPTWSVSGKGLLCNSDELWSILWITLRLLHRIISGVTVFVVFHMNGVSWIMQSSGSGYYNVIFV